MRISEAGRGGAEIWGRKPNPPVRDERSRSTCPRRQRLWHVLRQAQDERGEGRVVGPGAVAALLLLAACNDRPADTRVLAKVERQQSVEAVEDGRVNCALAGAQAFQRVCTVDREDGPRGLVLTVRHPDGGFHRLLVARDGRGVVPADGAEPAEVAIVDPGEIEVAIGDDVYRLPATVKRP